MIQILPHPDPFMLMYVRKEAVLSSQIEGTQSALQELLAAETQLFVKASAQDVGEVIRSCGHCLEFPVVTDARRLTMP